MLEFIEKEKLRIEEILKNDEEHQNKKVYYILYNKQQILRGFIMAKILGVSILSAVGYKLKFDKYYNEFQSTDNYHSMVQCIKPIGISV